MPKNEVPPEHIWEDSEGLELWWKRIEDKRSDGLTDGSSDLAEEDSELVDNDLASQFRKMV